MKINDKVYGGIEINEPVLVELINSKPLQRIKDVNQAGTQLVEPHRTTTRYDHCVGVMILLRNYGASLEEQIAGLLHDVPHTAFSHAVDFVFKEGQTQTYHERFLKKLVFDSEIPEILKKYNIDPYFVTEKHNFSLLEQDIPFLCADRIDYSLRDIENNEYLNRAQLDQVLASLATYEGKFVLKDADIALTYSRAFMRTCLDFWNSERTLATFEIIGELLRTALDKNVISESDLFLTDSGLLEILNRSKDTKVKNLLSKLTPDMKFSISETDFDLTTRGKARYIDPLILQDNKVQKLSEIKKDFENEILEFKNTVNRGHKIKIY